MSIRKLAAAAAFCLCSCLLFCAACSGGARDNALQPVSVSPRVDAPEGAAALPGLGQLAAAPRQSSAFGLTRMGNEVDISIQPHNYNSGAGSGDFSPAYSPGGPLGGAAFALYSFDATGYAAPLTLELYWLSAPSAGQAWLGLSNFSASRWDWYAIDPAQVVQNPAGFSTDYQNGSGTSYAVLLLTGSQAASLGKIRLGPNGLPAANYTVLPGLNLVQGNPFTMDAASSFDGDGFISKYEFDFGEGAGFEDHGGDSQVQHLYVNPGSYDIRLRVTDNDGGESQLAVDSVTVYPPGSEPTVSIQLAPQRPQIGKPVTIDASASMDSDGTLVKYEFDPENDGSFVDNGSNPVYEHTYDAAGVFSPQVRVTDDDGLVGENSAPIGVGWLRTFQGLGAYADIYCTLPDAQGNTYVCGMARFEEGNSDNLEGAFILKLNANGETQWTKQFEQIYDQGLTDLAFDMDGKLWAAGYDGKLNAGTNPVLLQIDPQTGDLLLQKEVAQDCDANFPARLAIDSQNQINLGFNADFAGVRTMAVMQFLSSGALRWLRKYDTEDSGYDRIFGDICVDAADRVYFCGREAVESMGADNDGAVVCLDSNGTLQWAKRLGDSNKPEEFSGICASGSYIYACGNYSDASQQCLLAQFSAADGSLGNVISYSNSSGTMSFTSCCPDSNSGCFVSGDVDDPLTEADASVLHYSSTGIKLFELAFGESGTEEANYLCKLHQGPDGAIFWGGETPSHNTGFAALMGSSSLIMKPLADLSDVMVEPAWTISDQSYGYADLSLTEDSGGGFVMRLYP